jgi:hypothetical protein
MQAKLNEVRSGAAPAQENKSRALSAIEFKRQFEIGVIPTNNGKSGRTRTSFEAVLKSLAKGFRNYLPKLKAVKKAAILDMGKYVVQVHNSEIPSEL